MSVFPLVANGKLASAVLQPLREGGRIGGGAIMLRGQAQCQSPLSPASLRLQSACVMLRSTLLSLEVGLGVGEVRGGDR